MRPSGSPEVLEARRRTAARLLAQGKSLTEVAVAVGSSVSSVKRWKDTLVRRGPDGLKAKPHLGPRPRLNAKQKAQLAQLLLRGARASGYANDLWTCRRVLKVIQRRFGVTYHVDYVGTLLHQLGWSVQKPEQRARERNEAAIQRWRKEEWPRIKKGRAQQASVVFLDESGFLLQPVRRRTWAPRGQTPVHNAWDRHDRWSVLGALTLAPWALRIGVYFQLYDHNIVAPDVVGFLQGLHRQLGRRLIVVWDRWSVHRSAARQLSRCDWLTIEYLPPYAPELNPVEAMWNHTKYTDLANFLPEDADHLHDVLRTSLLAQRQDAYLKRSYFRYAQLLA